MTGIYDAECVTVGPTAQTDWCTDVPARPQEFAVASELTDGKPYQESLPVGS
ncbi:hypothetical protein [Natronobacterium gregoryi]|uniref:hypothetical protein n=1 Tax=Natronobacterium gregoryi TaxID=44930 RepID=UPI0012DDCA3C|nr:hypothetical protein [Natronobacterium gregoryi]